MTNFAKKIASAGAFALAFAFVASMALGAGIYTPGFPLAGSVANTLPFSGNERIPADTLLASGISPQTEAIQLNQLIGAAAPTAVYNANAATTSTTATAVQTGGSCGFTVLDLTGTLGGAANLTTPTAAAMIAQCPNAIQGASYELRIIAETAANNWTVVGGTGVTVNGTATVVASQFTDWVVTLNQSAGTVTLQRAGSGTK